jgi:uridine kinase
MNFADLITERAREKSPLIVCIDGPAGAGKTTLSEQLADDSTHTIHMDNLYDGWEDPLGDNLTQRLTEWVIQPIVARTSLTLRDYNWFTNTFGDYYEIPLPRILIIEGVGSAQTLMRDVADITIFIDVETALGKKRVIERDGESMLNHIDHWQEREAQHFALHNTRDECEFIVTSL